MCPTEHFNGLNLASYDISKATILASYFLLSFFGDCCGEATAASFSLCTLCTSTRSALLVLRYSKVKLGVFAPTQLAHETKRTCH